MKKQMNFLHYILHESISSLTRPVYDTLKENSTRRVLVSLTDWDREELNIEYSDEEIPKQTWKKYIKEKVRHAAFTTICLENDSKEKKRNIVF